MEAFEVATFYVKVSGVKIPLCVVDTSSVAGVGVTFVESLAEEASIETFVVAFGRESMAYMIVLEDN